MAAGNAAVRAEIRMGERNAMPRLRRQFLQQRVGIRTLVHGFENFVGRGKLNYMQMITKDIQVSQQLPLLKVSLYQPCMPARSSAPMLMLMGTSDAVPRTTTAIVRRMALIKIPLGV